VYDIDDLGTYDSTARTAPSPSFPEINHRSADVSVAYVSLSSRQGAPSRGGGDQRDPVVIMGVESRDRSYQGETIWGYVMGFQIW
jgi:hypothetical protein